MDRLKDAASAAKSKVSGKSKAKDDKPQAGSSDEHSVTNRVILYGITEKKRDST